MRQDVFQRAIDHLSIDCATYGPASVLDHCKEHGLPDAATAPSISIDSYDRLPALLRCHDTMVLRLEAGICKGTHFVLVRVPGQLRDFFLFDGDVFDAGQGTMYFSRASLRQRYPYQVLSILSEASLVNLALSSGLLSHALHVDEDAAMASTAIGTWTFTFSLWAHSSLAHPTLRHNAGQVEVDAYSRAATAKSCCSLSRRKRNMVGSL